MYVPDGNTRSRCSNLRPFLFRILPFLASGIEQSMFPRNLARRARVSAMGSRSLASLVAILFQGESVREIRRPETDLSFLLIFPWNLPGTARIRDQ